MSAAENKERMAVIFGELAEGIGRAFVDSLSDDVAYTVIGSNSWSGTIVGKQAVLRDLFGPLRALLENPVRTKARRILADGEFVVVEAVGDNVTKRGARYDNTYCLVFRWVDGRIHSLVEYADTELMRNALGEREVSATAPRAG